MNKSTRAKRNKRRSPGSQLVCLEPSTYIPSRLGYIECVPRPLKDNPKIGYLYCTRKQRTPASFTENASQSNMNSQLDFEYDFEAENHEVESSKKRTIYNKWMENLFQLANSFLCFVSKCQDGCSDKRDITPLSPPPSSKMFEIVFCGCKTIPEQLVEMGILPASLNNVQYGIHIRLLNFMIDMRNVLATSGQGLATLYNKINMGTERKISKAFCQNLLPIYIRLMAIVESKVEKAASGFEELNGCPACPDQVDSNVTIDDCQYVAMDGNFSLKCERRKDVEGDVGKELEQIGRFDSNFHAGSGSLAKSIKYSIKGLFAASCARHESVIKLVDMETGEGFKYSLSIINQLLGDSGSDGQSADNSPNINVMYDVVCKLAKSLKANFSGLMEKSKLAVLIFHVYAHVQHCQVKLNPKYRDGFGLTDGECLKRLWSYLNCFVTITRKMGQANQKLVLYRAIKFCNETKKVELGLMLESKYVKAKCIIEESRKALEGFDCVVIEREWKQHVNKVEKSENYVDIADLMESGRKIQGNIALFLVNFTILRQLRELTNDANGNHVKDKINRLNHKMEKLKAKIQKEVEGFQEPDEKNTNLIKYIEENAQLEYNEFLAYKKNIQRCD
ncbi:hypothetical protein PHYBLDRAFT_66051 [Phycomyces blakesleeanus NRRL 1555(-)]|uniref:CxC1-like cysteine cluster associated with KDZ transposases domain-containing protein n=1 Tax=Phycomyces blakesleeanus (strain ATCC 8743b / DSM 1359 / FGSC 10004 / NBRC 33097 / NRRL 1555) TaxID=763407 RepID=A0A162TTR1_PHYB8|nr:hypothetical protein PHYBLDRAFT_66051 [Phycomyces blakesleeanus NRRL 1555(-)]OAD69733.1 hypothetical protein PHYBLDRAFT_66051 [Phycomyces blakesleeanus NRRL 1555(-)]|eukprot:XP_018287773.1 hypothetical protein PHYBLDRAFT_66051 [Phycomyces blakesleeanus NRRL 1555(-)]